MKSYLINFTDHQLLEAGEYILAEDQMYYVGDTLDEAVSAAADYVSTEFADCEHITIEINRIDDIEEI